MKKKKGTRNKIIPPEKRRLHENFIQALREIKESGRNPYPDVWSKFEHFLDDGEECEDHDLLEKQLDAAREKRFSYFFIEPETGKNPKTKKVSVKYFFPGISRKRQKITIKIDALPGVWMEWEWQFPNISFPSIAACIDKRTSGRSIAELEECYQSSPEAFLKHFYNWYILPAKAEEKKESSPKPRGRITHKLTKDEMSDIRRTSRHLYAFLCVWVKRPTRDWPIDAEKYFNRNKIQRDIKNKWKRKNKQDKMEVFYLFKPKALTWDIISKHYGNKHRGWNIEKIGLSKKQNPQDIFYEKYIFPLPKPEPFTKSDLLSLPKLKKLYEQTYKKGVQISHCLPPLDDFFSK